MEKIEVLAPIPIARVRAAMAVNAGDFLKKRYDGATFGRVTWVAIRD